MCAFIYIPEYIMEFAPFEPLQSDIIAKKQKFEQEREKAQKDIVFFVKKHNLVELKSKYFGCDSYYMTPNGNIVKTSNLKMDFVTPSYDEISNIKKWNNIKD